jgi:hypothetical protein
MANDPFTIRIFVPDGDPDGVRIIDRMNWTGLGIVFPRGKHADAEGFLREVLQILPFVGLRAFEKPKPVATSQSGPAPTVNATADKGMVDTIIVPAQQDGFEKVVAGGMLPKIKYVAAYRSQPAFAIALNAPVGSIELYSEDGKYKLIFAEPGRPIDPNPFADTPSGSMQGRRYTCFAKLTAAKKVTDLFGGAG